jgi:4-amino-4-deoxy-L-arabinose transferase-like glycosyltransferase
MPRTEPLPNGRAAPETARGRSGRLDGSGRLLLAAIVALAAVHVLVAAFAGLTEDEAYYRLWALAPAMSYLDHPPMVGWMIAAGRWIAGDNPLGIRLVAVAGSLLGPFVLWRTAQILFGPTIAQRAVWFALAMPLLAVGSVIITPDAPSVLFWGLTGWALAELYVSQRADWWLAIGLFAGLGLLSKYTNLFVGAGLLLWLLLLPANWRWFRSWQLWAGGALAALLALPVVVWNANHGWASFAKQFGRVAGGDRLTPVYFLELVGGYLGLASPLIAVLGLIGLWRVTRSALSERDQARTLVAASIVPLLAYMLLHTVHDRVQANWVAPLYPALALCAAIALSDRWPGARPFETALAKWSLGVGLLLTGLLFVHILRPLPLLSPSKDPTSQTRGWAEFAAEVDALRRARGACWVATTSYATTGQLAYQLDAKTPVIELTDRIRYVHLPRVDDALLKCPALYVELERRAKPDVLASRFRTVTPLGTLTRKYGDRPLAAYTIYRLADPIGRPLPD